MRITPGKPACPENLRGFSPKNHGGCSPSVQGDDRNDGEIELGFAEIRTEIVPHIDMQVTA
jgi:hypothetical protein